MRGLLAVLTAITGLGAACTQPSAAPAPQTITRHYTPSDRVSGRYQYVPFDVPRGTTQLRVRYSYDRADGENVVDLGLLEPGSVELGETAWRGYSGGAKSEVVVAASHATPGYLAGPLATGTWHVLLGLYRVREGGVDVTLAIETSPDGDRTPAADATVAPRIAQPAVPAEARWYAGALHTHTQHSDGAVAAADLLRRARDLDFDFVAITDHNNTTHAFDAALLAEAAQHPRPLWIVGEEVTTPAGHASVWGLAPGAVIDFRVGAGDTRIADLVAAAHHAGALFSINHPASTCVGCGWEHAVVEGIDAIEVSNGRHGEVDEALARWDALLARGRRITAVGSSDWHSPDSRLDLSHARVFATALTREALLAGIRDGRVIVMLQAGHPAPEVRVTLGEQHAGVGETLTLGSPGPAAVALSAPSLAGGRAVMYRNDAPPRVVTLDRQGAARVTTPVSPGYLRIEFLDAGQQRVAITNPVYLSRP